MNRRLGVTALLVWAMAVGAPLPAQAEPSAESRALRALFDEADKAETQGRYAEALPKFRDVMRARPTPGVRFHVASCEEHLGQLVSALEDYKTARDQAEAQNAADVLHAVEGRIGALEKRIPQVTLAMPAGVDGASVTLQGRDVPRALWGAPMSVDPGMLVISASAPGRVSFSVTQKIDEGQRGLVITVTLEKPQTTTVTAPTGSSTGSAASPPPPPPPPPEPPPSSGGSRGSRTAAIGTTIGAGVLAGFGVAAFLVAGANHGSGVTECATRAGSCDDLRTGVRVWDYTALGAWIGAAVATTVAVVLWVTPNREGARTGVWIGPGRVGLTSLF